MQLFFKLGLFTFFWCYNLFSTVDAGGSRAVELFVHSDKKSKLNLFSAGPDDELRLKSIEVAPDKTFYLVAKINQRKVDGQPEIKMQGLDNFKQKGAPDSFNQVSIFNGQIENVYQVKYALSGKKEGVYKLGPATIVANGQSYKSDSVTVTVNKSSAVEPVAAFLKIVPSVNGSPLEGKSIFVGQKIDLQFQVFFRSEVFSRVLSCNEVIGSCADFVITPSDTAFAHAQCFINGQQYNCYSKSFSLVCQSSGLKELPRISCIYRAAKIDDEGSSSAFGVFGMMLMADTIEDGTLVANNGLPIVIDVKEIGEGVDAIGEDFSIELQSTNKKLEFGQATTIKAIISGNGDFGIISAPELDLPEGCKVYPSKNYFLENKTKDGKKTEVFEYVVQICQEGEVVVQPQKFVYFDTKTEKKVELESNQLVFYVNKSTAPLASPSPSKALPVDSSQEKKIPEHEQRAEDEVVSTSSSGTDNPFLYLLILFLVTLFCLAIFYRKRLGAGYTKTFAFRKARSALNKSAMNYEVIRIYYIFLEYFSVKLHLNRETLDSQEIYTALCDRGVDQELIKETISYLENAADIVFGKGKEFYGQVETTMFFKQAIDLINKIDRSIKN